MKCYIIVIADNVQNRRPENDNNWYTIIKNNNGNIIVNNLFAYCTKKLSWDIYRWRKHKDTQPAYPIDLLKANN